MTRTSILLLACGLVTVALWAIAPWPTADATPAGALDAAAPKPNDRAVAEPTPAGARVTVEARPAEASTEAPPPAAPFVLVTVHDDAAEPVPDARVHLIEAGAPTVGAEVTDLDGRARLAWPGRAIEVEAAKAGVGRSGRVTVARPDRELVLELRRQARVHGRVLLADGQPARGARVRGTLAGMRLSGAQPPAPYATTCDDGGAFTLTVAPDLVLQFVAWEDRRNSMPGRVATVAGGDHEVELRFPGAWTIAGSLVDPDGHPVPGTVRVAEVVAGPTDDPPEPVLEEIDAAGRFRVEMVQPGRFLVQAFHDDAWTEPTLVEVSAERPHPDVCLHLPASLPLDGRVRCAGEPPAPGTRVRLVPAPRSDGPPALPAEELVHHAPVARTDAEGNFTFAAVVSGVVYDLVVVPDHRHLQVAVRRHGVRAGDRNVVIEVDAQEARGAVLTLELAYDDDDAPVQLQAAALVVPKDDGTRRVTALAPTVEDGRLQLPPMALESTFGMALRPRDRAGVAYAPVWLDSIRLDGDETRRLRLPRAAALPVCVLGRDGRPRRGLRLYLSPGEDIPGYRGAGTVSDVDGRGTLAGLPPGKAVLHVGTASAWFLEETVHLAPGINGEVVVNLRR